MCRDMKTYFIPGMAILIVMFFLLFPQAVFNGKVLYPGDLLYLYEPWHMEFNPDYREPSNWILFDEVLEFYPWREHMCRSLSDGILPLWDPTCFCGYPFSGLFQTALLYLPDRLMDWLPFRIFPLIRAFFHISIAGLGCLLFLKQKGCSGTASCFGTVTFAFSGFMLVWLGHPHIKVAAWLPWIYLALDFCFRYPVKGLTSLTLVGCLAISAGHIETALHVATAALIYLLITWYLDRRRVNFVRLSSTAIFASIIAILFAAGMILPFAEYLVRSVAYAVRSGGVVVQPYLDKVLMITHLVPKLFGSSAGGDYWYPGFNSAELGGGFAGVLAMSLGMAALMASKVRNQRIVHGFICLFCFGVVYKIPGIYHFAECLPGYKMSYNFRLVLPMIFSLSVLAAFCLDDILQKQKPVLTAGISISALIGICVLSIPLWIQHIPCGSNAGRTNPVPHMIAALLPLVLFWLAAVAYMSGKLRRSILAILAISLAMGELIWFGRGFNPSVPVEDIAREPASAPYFNAARTGQPFRVLPAGYTYPPHTALNYGIHDIRGNDALTPLNVEDYVCVGEPSIRAPHMLPALRMMWINTLDSRIWNTLNIEYVAMPLTTPPPKLPNLVFESVQGGVAVFKNRDAMPRAFLAPAWECVSTPAEAMSFINRTDYDPSVTSVITSVIDIPSQSDTGQPPGSAMIMQYDPHAVYIEADCPGDRLLVLSDTAFPGWEVYVDNARAVVLETNRMMRGVLLERGRHGITFRYRPISFLLGIFLTCLGVFMVIVVATSGCKSGQDDLRDI
jgi:hypothetical protein